MEAVRRDEGEAGTGWECVRCVRAVVPVRPRWYWRLAVVGVWAVIVVMLLCAAFLSIAFVPLVPFALFIGISLLAPVNEEAFREPRCPHCGVIVVRARAPRGAGAQTPGAESAAATEARPGRVIAMR